MQGLGKIVYDNAESLEVEYIDGYIHGLVRRRNAHGDISLIGVYEWGEPCGRVWQLVPGGGVITGNII